MPRQFMPWFSFSRLLRYNGMPATYISEAQKKLSNFETGGQKMPHGGE